jgi:hypothetical protein
MEIKNINIYNIYPAILGIRNSYKSKDKSDSNNIKYKHEETYDSFNHAEIGEKDFKLIQKLLKRGKKAPEYCNQERKFLRQILVSMDIIGSIKFWAQMDTFKIGTVRNSESTMHSITKGVLEQSDFEREISLKHLDFLNANINFYNEIKTLKGTADRERRLKHLFELIDANLPAGYVLESHWTGNYENIRNIYHGRKAHKMYWWHQFCEVIEKLPYFDLIIKEL